MLRQAEPNWLHQQSRSGDKTMKRTYFAEMSLALALPHAQAQQPSTAANTQPSAESQTGFNALPGRWVRVEGGYVITVKAVDANGKLDASYANPNPLPFHTAVATNDLGVLRLFFELRASGYNGSTYTLTYDAANDQLKGIYDQVVAKQKFEVTFVRAKPR
jgi:hypothetical protein